MAAAVAALIGVDAWGFSGRGRIDMAAQACSASRASRASRAARASRASRASVLLTGGSRILYLKDATNRNRKMRISRVRSAVQPYDSLMLTQKRGVGETAIALSLEWQSLHLSRALCNACFFSYSKARRTPTQRR